MKRIDFVHLRAITFFTDASKKLNFKLSKYPDDDNFDKSDDNIMMMMMVVPVVHLLMMNHK